MGVTWGQITETYYGPGGGKYQVVAKPEQTGNIHFAFEAIEPPGGGPPLHIQTRHEELFFVLVGEITFWLDGQVIRRSAEGRVRAAWHAALFQELFGQACARADFVHARRYRRIFRLRQAASKWQQTAGGSAYGTDRRIGPLNTGLSSSDLRRYFDRRIRWGPRPV